MKKKIDIIDECENCSHVWWYLGTTECCLLMDKKPCYKDQNYDDAVIPPWCPLSDASPDTELKQYELEKEIRWFDELRPSLQTEGRMAWDAIRKKLISF